MLDVGGVPLLVRVYRNLTSGVQVREIALACNAARSAELGALLPIPIVVDRWPRCGPLGGMLSGFDAMRARRIFVAAGDAPFVDAALMQRLVAAWEDGDECVVPQTGAAGLSRLEPLAALYDRAAFLREGHAVLREGQAAVVGVIERLRTRTITTENARTFTNVNTPAEYGALSGPLPRHTEA
ncbi:MAG: molybdenum cofactor guanylyltransferase [Candidatus Eremiobacteraeota bacterium]|nr:molybdenum cofactor guanylyltransferase [Candidatus Eremiobacteraeota bacterium]